MQDDIINSKKSEEKKGEAFNSFAPSVQDDEIVMINEGDLNMDNISSKKLIGNIDSGIALKNNKKLDEKCPTDSDSITDNETSDCLASFMAALDHYDTLLSMRKQEKMNTFASFQKIEQPDANDLKVIYFLINNMILVKSL